MHSVTRTQKTEIQENVSTSHPSEQRLEAYSVKAGKTTNCHFFRGMCDNSNFKSLHKTRIIEHPSLKTKKGSGQLCGSK